MTERVDALIIGGGIAGISLAARLAPEMRVAALEAEEQLGTHATGRSAALLVEAYGPPEIRELTRRSRPFFEAPPPGFTESPLSARRGGLTYADAANTARLGAEFELARRTARVEWLERDGVLGACPVLRPDAVAAGFLEPDALDLDAHGLLQGFARQARRAGALLRTAAPVERIEKLAKGWRVSAAGQDWETDVVVNAAGAWADGLARLAGASVLGLQPMRRSAATLPVPGELEDILADLPFVAPVDESFYFKPEARAIMVSLAEETPSEPCHAFAEDLDIAVALERFHAATTVPRARPAATWAGLRTFAPDRRPVVGFDGQARGFFWCAGQGGYGIQTSPALSELAAKLILGAALDPDESESAARLSVGRFGAGRR